MKDTKKGLSVSICLLTAFILWTAIVCFVDVQQIGPMNSPVGLAGINQFVHNLMGVHLMLYAITDWLGLVPVGVCAGFGMLGLAQWVKRKDIRKVDFSILALGGFYLIIIAVYLLFESVVVNHRPILINGNLEASYPSSTTMLAMCVMPTAVAQCNARIKHKILRNFLVFVMIAFTAFMAIGRLISGVHWFSDIVGGVLLSAGLVALYVSVCKLKLK